MFCPKCGKKLADTAKFCTDCGTPLTSAVPAEQMPVAEQSPMVEAPAVEQTPVVEESPVVEEFPVTEEETPAVEEASEETVVLQDQVPVQEQIPVIPVQKPKKEKKQKPPKEKKEKVKIQKKKKKAWPWVVGILTVLIAAAVVFGLFWVKPYFEKKAAYEKAVTLLEEHSFDEALEQFKAADNYKDAKEQAEQLEGLEEIYKTASGLFGEKKYSQARTMYEALDDYKDAPQMVQQCYLQEALECLAAHDVEKAMELAGQLDADMYGVFSQTYSEKYADIRFLAALESALQQTVESSDKEDADLYEIVKQEISAMEEFDGAVFADEELAAYAENYFTGLERQLDSFEDNGVHYDAVEFYTAGSVRLTAIEGLIDRYGLFAQDIDLASYFAGRSYVYDALAQIEASLQQLIDVESEQGADEVSYLPYKNNTPYAFRVTVYHDFYLGNTFVDSDSHELYIIPGETAFVPVFFPTAEIDTWLVNWEITDVVLREDVKLNSGVYKLAGMIIEDVYYSLDALATADLNKDSVIVTLQSDGTGIWLEMGTSNAFTCKDGVIAITGSELRLPVTYGPGKMVVNLGDYIYILEVDTSSASAA